MKPIPNTTPDGQLACVFKTAWLNHFAPPIGNGLGCVACETGQLDLFMHGRMTDGLQT